MNMTIPKRRTIFKCLYVAAVLLASVFCGILCACGDGKTDVVSAEFSDVHIKLNDTGFDFSAGLTGDVEVDASAVNVNAVGSYEIVYTRQGVEVKKTAYVYGTPTISKGGQEVAERYEITYAQAKAVDFMDAESMDIVAKDSFGGSLKVAAKSNEYFVGRYGEYVVTYTAIDKAGNTVGKTVGYSVTGAVAPTITFDTPDVADDTVIFNIGLTENERDALVIYFGDLCLEEKFYTVSSSGIAVQIEALRQYLENGVRKFTVKFDNAEWYAEKEISFTDEQPLALASLPFDNWVYQSIRSFEVPAPQKQKPQAIDFEYNVKGVSDCEIKLIEDRKVLIVNKVGEGKLDYGAYEITVTAKRGDEEPVVKSAIVGVYDENAYAHVLAPMTNEQHFNLFMETDKDLPDEHISLDFDSEKGAYRVENFTNSGYNSIKIVQGSEIADKIEAAINEGDKYLAFDIYSESIDFATSNLWLYFNNRAGTATSRQELVNNITTSVFVCKTGTSERIVNRADIECGEWYSVYFELGDYTSEARNKEFLMIRQEKGVYYLRNLRIEDALPDPQVVIDGGIYGKGDELKLPYDRYGSAVGNTITEPDGNVVAISDSFIVNKAGAYVATIGGVTELRFEVVDYHDYTNIGTVSIDVDIAYKW